jgi:hypothetical protein
MLPPWRKKTRRRGEPRRGCPRGDSILYLETVTRSTNGAHLDTDWQDFVKLNEADQMKTFIGSVVTAIGAAAAASKQETGRQEVKDTYAGIRAYITNRYAAVDIAALEEDPLSPNQQLLIEEELASAGAEDDATLAWLAAGFLETLKSQLPDASYIVGLTFEDIRAGIDIQIRKIGTGVTPRI